MSVLEFPKTRTGSAEAARALLRSERTAGGAQRQATPRCPAGLRLGVITAARAEHALRLSLTLNYTFWSN